jgi:hypothetical protein
VSGCGSSCSSRTPTLAFGHADNLRKGTDFQRDRAAGAPFDRPPSVHEMNADLSAAGGSNTGERYPDFRSEGAPVNRQSLPELSRIRGGSSESAVRTSLAPVETFPRTLANLSIWTMRSRSLRMRALPSEMCVAARAKYRSSMTLCRSGLLCSRPVVLWAMYSCVLAKLARIALASPC